MRRLFVLPALLVAACAAPPVPSAIDQPIQEVFGSAQKQKAPAAPPLEQQLLPPLRMEMPKLGGEPIDQRFDLSVSNAPAAQVFNSLVAGTRYSMLVPPNLTGNISVNLKDVTLREALDAIREVYGYEYKIDGTRIFIQSPGLQARVFQVNYLAAQRRGLSQLRVTSNTLVGRTGSGNLGLAGGAGIAGTSGITGAGGAGGQGAGQVGGALSPDSTRVTTNQEAVFWSDLCEALVAITFPPSRASAADIGQPPIGGVGALGSAQAPEDRQRAICNRRHAESDRSVVVSPQSGIIVVRATAAELRAVDEYLRATRLAVERQVMLEAKIIEVTLDDQFQSGINWAAFGGRVAIGQITRPQAAPRTVFESSSTQLQTQGTGVVAGLRSAAEAQLLTGPAGAVVGLAAATNSFAALVTFLETQGNVQVLSSPRVATINNQKAVLKVGQDELFVSNVTVTPPTIGTVATPATVSPEFSPYFSGIVLDVTPQIDDRGMITLHIHPTINDIIQVQRTLDLGSAGSFNIPTARNTIRETDTIVRVADGNIVAIGGLMRTELNDVRGGIPGAPDSGPASVLLRSTNRVREKKELVILLKPSILESDRDWGDGMREAHERIEALGREMGARDGR